MLLAGHPDENVLEMYCMEKLDGPALEAVEDHLLVCADCQTGSRKTTVSFVA